MKKSQSFKEMLKEYCEIIQLETTTICDTTTEKDLAIFTMISGSDSVKLVWDYAADLYYLEVFPINANTDIEVFNFNDKKSAITAFKLWRSYYELVVAENCKMF